MEYIAVVKLLILLPFLLSACGAIVYEKPEDFEKSRYKDFGKTYIFQKQWDLKRDKSSLILESQVHEDDTRFLYNLEADIDGTVMFKLRKRF